MPRQEEDNEYDIPESGPTTGRDPSADYHAAVDDNLYDNADAMLEDAAQVRIFVCNFYCKIQWYSNV